MTRHLGRYEVEAELGRGSMGVVYRASDPRLGRSVAVKTILLPAGLSDDQRRDYHVRFLREARAAGALSHPGIVTVYDVEEPTTGDDPLIAMEFVPGRTLADLLRTEGPLEPHEAPRTFASRDDAPPST